MPFVFFTSRRRRRQRPLSQLTRHKSKKPNNETQSSAATTAAACRALALVFQAAGSRGELLEGTAEASAAAAGSVAEGGGEEGGKEHAEAEAAERSYRRWLRSRFADHARRLRSVLSLSGAFPTAQAAAARAALEASRSAVTGRFDAGLLGSCLDALLLADAASVASSSSSSSSSAAADPSASSSSSGAGGASAEAVSVILSKSDLADVRHSLLKSLARCAAALAASFSSSSSSVSASSAAAGASSQQEALRDAASTLVDVLVRVPPLPELPPREGGGGGGDASANNSNLLLQGVGSWCGGEAVGRAAAASGAASGHPDTLLGWLQSDISANAIRPQGRSLRPQDRSVQIHSCHSPARQVDVLREVLLGLLADDETLEPRDILVMCPDIERYAPLIAADFGLGDIASDGHPAHRLRVRLADRSLVQTNPLLQVAAQLLSLAGSRVTATEVLNLAQSAPVRDRFGFTDDDLEDIIRWVREANIRWGFDPEHRTPYGVDFVHNTWRFGLDRVLAGVALSDDSPGWIGNTLPLDDVGSNSDSPSTSTDCGAPWTHSVAPDRCGTGLAR